MIKNESQKYLIAFWLQDRMCQNVINQSIASWILDNQELADGPYILVNAMPIDEETYKLLWGRF